MSQQAAKGDELNLILYSALFVAGLCHAQTVQKSASMLVFCLIMVVLSATCIICSIILIIGLWKDNRFLLLPWTVAVSMTTLIDVMVSFYLIRDAITEPFLAVLFVTDVLICAVNVYALLCVLSQYQEYKIGQVRINVVQPRDHEIVREQPPRPPITCSVTDDVNSSSAQMIPSGSPLKGIASTSAKLHCELTTITEEMNYGGGPSSPLTKDKPPSKAIELSVLKSKIENTQLENVQVENTQFENVQVDNTQFESIQVDNTQLENVRVDNTQFENVQVENTQFENVRVEKAQLENVHVEDTQQSKDN